MTTLLGNPKRLNIINKYNNVRIRFFSSRTYIQNSVSRGDQSFANSFKTPAASQIPNTEPKFRLL